MCPVCIFANGFIKVFNFIYIIYDNIIRPLKHITLMAKNKPTKEQILVLAHMHVGIGLAIAGSLANLYSRPMILQRYRSNIIGWYKNCVPSSYTTFFGGLLILAVGLALTSISVDSAINALSPSWFEVFQICSTGQVIATAAVSQNGQTTLTDESEIDSRKNVHSNNKHVVYIYVRQSQTNDEKSTSIETQIAECKKKAYDDGADDVIVFEDKDESGFSTEREGYQELMKKMQNDPRPVYVHRINRFGRSPLDAVAEIAKLHRECELTLKTCNYGHYDLTDMDDILFLFLNLLFAGKTVMQRIEAAWEVIYQKFEEDRNWHTWFKNVPIGYKLNDEGWIEPSEHGKTVVQAIANELLHADTRSDVVDRIKSISENSSIDSSTAKNNKTSERIGDLTTNQIKGTFEQSGYEIEDFDSQKLKRLLTNTVLIGEVRFPRNQPDEDQKVLKDHSLQLLDEEFFEEVNESIDRTAQKYSTDSDENVDMEYLADHGMILRSMDVVDNIKPVCPECNRGMVKNGQDHEYPLEDGRIAHYWKCNACGNNDDCDQTSPQQKVPYNREWEAIKNELNQNYKDEDGIILLKLVD